MEPKRLQRCLRSHRNVHVILRFFLIVERDRRPERGASLLPRCQLGRRGQTPLGGGRSVRSDCAGTLERCWPWRRYVPAARGGPVCRHCFCPDPRDEQRAAEDGLVACWLEGGHFVHCPDAGKIDETRRRCNRHHRLAAWTACSLSRPPAQHQHRTPFLLFIRPLAHLHLSRTHPPTSPHPPSLAPGPDHEWHALACPSPPRAHQPRRLRRPALAAATMVSCAAP